MPSVASSASHTAPRAEAGAPARDGLRVGGLVAFSATDFPDKLSAVVFCQGCPWRCRYCHNPHLIEGTRAGSHAWADVLAWLGERHGLLDAVVFSGGEPLAQASLPAAMDAVRALGFAVGLHSGGAYPRRLAQALALTDWIGLDVKAPRRGYPAVTGVADSGDAAFASLDLVLRSGVPCELRTTVHAALTDAPALLCLAGELAARGVERWTLQRFRARGCGDAQLATGHADPLDDALLARLRASVPRIDVR